MVRARNTRVKLEACKDCTSCFNGGTSGARQEHTGRVKSRGVRRVHKLQHRWHGWCARSTDQAEQTRGVCPRSRYKGYNNITTSRSSLSLENYQHAGQRSARGKAGFKIRRQEYGRLSGMVFQAPRQPVTLRQPNPKSYKGRSGHQT